MRHIFSALLLCALPLTNWAQDADEVILDFSKSDVRSVLGFYERLTHKPVFAVLDLQALVTVQTAEPISRGAAIELIRTTLLKHYGIELRTTDRGETLAAWSSDPKYPRRSDPAMTEAERDARPKRRIRIVKPESDK